MEFLNKIDLNHEKLLESRVFNCAWIITVIFIVIFLWFSAINKHYQKYWGHETIIGKNQGTIFAVQTVENNIAAAAYPAVIAELLHEGDINSIHPYMSTLYGLGGLAVTICDKGSIKENCINEKPVSYTRSWWINDNNISQLIKESDFSVLTDNHEPGIDWRYKAPKDHQIIDLDFEPEGNIIGRLYYIRNERPSLSEQLTDWFQAGFQTTSTGNKYFGILSLTYFLCLVLFLICANYIRVFYLNKAKFKKKSIELEAKFEKANSEISKKNAEIKKHEEEEKSLQKSLDDMQAKNEKIKNELNDSIDTIKIFEEQVDAENDPIEKEKKQAELKKLNDKIKSLENNLSDVNIKLEGVEDTLTKEKKITKSLRTERDKYKAKADDIKLAKSIKVNNIYTEIFRYYIRGLNDHSDFKVKFHPDVLNHDLELLRKEGKDYESIITLTINCINAYCKLDHSPSTLQPMKLNDYKFDIYHNKSQTLRIYFSHVNTNKNNDICIGAIWNADRSFHSKNDGGYNKKKNQLCARLNSMVN